MKSLFTDDYSLYDYSQELLQATADDKVNEIQFPDMDCDQVKYGQNLIYYTVGTLQLQQDRTRI